MKTDTVRQLQNLSLRYKQCQVLGDVQSGMGEIEFQSSEQFKEKQQYFLITGIRISEQMFSTIISKVLMQPSKLICLVIDIHNLLLIS